LTRRPDCTKSDISYLISEIVPNMLSCLSENNVKTVGDHNGYGECIIVYRKNIYKLQGDCSLLKYDDFYAIGSGGEPANTIMQYHSDGQTLHNLDIEKLFKAVSDVCCTVSKEFTILICA